MNKFIIRKTMSIILVFTLMFGMNVTSTFASAQLQQADAIHMEIGQSVDLCNLVYRVTNNAKKPYAYCTSVTGFKGTSKNTDIVKVENGKIIAVGVGETDVVVKKNGQKFTVHFYVAEQNNTLSSEYKKINKYLDTLSNKYPNKASIEGRGSTFIKGVSKLESMIWGYEIELENDEYEGDLDVNPRMQLSGALDVLNSNFLCIENPREYFRLTEMAQKYIRDTAKKSKLLGVKSASANVQKTSKTSTQVNVAVKLNKALNIGQCLATYAEYNPYTAIGNLPTSSSWTKNLTAHYYYRVYRVSKNGKESFQDYGQMIGKCNNKTLTATILLNVKYSGTYKIYFSDYYNEYSATFTLK